MEVTCPIQCTYKLTEVTVRKDLAQQSTQETLKGPRGHFRLNTPHRRRIFSFPLSERNNQNRTLKFDIKAKRAHAHV